MLKRARVKRLKYSQLAIREDMPVIKSTVNRLVSQRVTLQERSVQGCERVKYKPYSHLDDRWVTLTTSKAPQYFRARRDEIRCAFNPP